MDHYNYSGNTDLVVNIDGDNNVTITYPAGWTGSETIAFAAYNGDCEVIDSDAAIFTVDLVPIVENIPDQRAPFKTFDLDDYLSGITPSLVTWSATDPGDGWNVGIDGDNVVTVTAPAGATGTKSITFTATATSCGGAVSDGDDAAFTVRPPPPPAPITASDVPAISTIGAILLVGLLGIIAMGRIRRRFD